MLRKMWEVPFYLDTDEPGGGGGGGDGDEPSEGEDVTWDAYVESLDDDVKSLYQEHVSGLTSALEKERKANKEAKGELKDKLARLEELEEAEKKRKEAELSETEKLQQGIEEREAKIATLQGELEQTKAEFESERLKFAVMALASEMGFANAEDAYNLADLSKVERNDEGKLEGAKEALEELKKSGRLPTKEDSHRSFGTPPRRRSHQRNTEKKERRLPIPKF